MANETFKDASGTTKYRKSTGAGDSGDPAVTHVNVDACALPTGAATSAKQDTIIGHVDGIEALLGTMDADTGGIASSAASIDGKVTACNTGAVVLAAGTAAFGKLSANSGVDIGDVDVASVVPGTGASNLGKAEDAAHSSGDVGVMALSVRQNTAAATSGADGDYQPLITDTNGRLHVIEPSAAAATTALQLIDDTVFTDDATFTPGTSKLLVIGGQCDDDSTDAVDEGDAGALRMTKERKLRVVAAIDSASMQSGNDQVTPKFAVIAAASSGDNTLVAGVTSKKIRVLSYTLMASAAVNAKFQSSTGGDISGLLYCAANTGAAPAYSPVGHFETVAGEDLQLNLSGAVAVGGHLTYIEVD